MMEMIEVAHILKRATTAPSCSSMKSEEALHV